ncbi:MAG: CPBP family intramembrane metalloprotease [Tidjanibacter sp.]|nr:CPBP family intramembrane metalloprotease [Tidjanibacter sp.]
MRKTLIPIGVALVLWFVMFSPWTAPHLNFWLTMALSGAILTSMSLVFSPELRDTLKENFRVSDVPIGVAIGALLWGVFWVGDKVAVWMFPFADGEIGSIYAMRDGMDYLTIGLLLLFVVGPAEEIFWRGFVQEKLGQRWSPTLGFIITTAIYALAHIWSLNFMLIVAAGVAGGVWGLLYKLFPKRLWALIISHAVWDVAVFLVFPI